MMYGTSIFSGNIEKVQKCEIKFTPMASLKQRTNGSDSIALVLSQRPLCNLLIHLQTKPEEVFYPI